MKAERLANALYDAGYLFKGDKYLEEVITILDDILSDIFREDHINQNPHLYDGKHERYSCDPFSSCGDCR